MFGRAVFEAIEVKGCLMLNFEFNTLNYLANWKVDLCMSIGSKALIKLSLLFFFLHYLQEKVFEEKLESQINQKFEIIWHTDIYFTFSRLKNSTSNAFDLKGLKNGTTKIFENNLKSMQIFQILMVGKYEF